MSLRFRLSFLLLVIALAPAFAFLWLHLREREVVARAYGAADVERRWHVISAGIDRILGETRRGIVEEVARRLPEGAAVSDTLALARILAEVAATQDVVDELALVGPNAELLCTSSLELDSPTRFDPGASWLLAAGRGEASLVLLADPRDTNVACGCGLFLAFPVPRSGGAAAQWTALACIDGPALLAAAGTGGGVHDGTAALIEKTETTFALIAAGQSGTEADSPALTETLSVARTSQAGVLEDEAKRGRWCALLASMDGVHTQLVGHEQGLHLLYVLPDPARATPIDASSGTALIGILVALLAALFAGWRVYRTLLLPLARLGGELEDVAARRLDLARPLTTVEDGEISGLSHSVNLHLATLSATVRELKESSTEIRAEMRQLIAHSTAIARRIGREVGDIAQVGEEMNDFLEQEEALSKTIDHAVDLARDGQQSTRRGDEIIGSVVASFDQLLDRMQSFSRDTRKLAQSVQEIHNDSKALDHIAERSSLLALNVSIEANRSAGKAHGVDVVANEIQLLSDKTIDSTRRIRAVIARVVEESQLLIRRLEEEEGQLLQGWSEQAREAHRALGVIRDSTSAVATEVGSILRLNRHQAHFSGKVRRHLKETRRLIHNIVLQVSRTNERISSVDRLLGRLDANLNRFQVGADELIGVEEISTVEPEGEPTTAF